MFIKRDIFSQFKYIVFVGILFILVGCADRERNNPLDPQNTETKGKPVGLDITSFGHKNILSWNPVRLEDLLGIKILRNSSIDSIFREVAIVTNKSSYEDQNVDFGVTYSYKIQYITESFQSPLSEEITITPGPSSIWVTTGSSGSIIKLTHDASHKIFENNQFLYTIGIASVGYSNGIFMTDFFLDQVIRVTENGNVNSWISGFNNPIDIDYDQRKTKFWVIDRDLGDIILADTLGFSTAKVANFQSPVALSVDKLTGNCWVADSGNDQIGLINSQSSSVTRFSNFINPNDVDAISSSRSCWVADSSRVVHIDSNGNTLVQVTGFNEATNVAVNERTGDCWVIDWYFQPNQSKVIKVSNTGVKELELIGFYDPQSLDVDTFDGSCIVADRLNFRIVKISESGQVIGEWQTSGPPRNVKVVTP